MRTLIFIVLVPITCAVVTGYYGVGWFSEGKLLEAALINIPVCALSAFIGARV